MKLKLLITVFIAVVILLLTQCSKSKPEEGELYSKGISTVGFTYYKNDSSYLTTSAQSGHGKPYFRVRFNAIAQAALTDRGRLPVGSAFPDGSIIVKELYDAQGGPISLLAVIEKSPGSTLSGDGWLWGEYYADGTPGTSVTRKGNDCTNCHSAIGSRDDVRLFELFP